MAEKQNLVEEALIQMKSLETVVAENAKGILASTMKEEIGELVKESLTETEEDSDLELDNSYNSLEEDEDETEIGDEDLEDTDLEDTDDELPSDDEDDLSDMSDMDMSDMGMMSDDDDSYVDLRNASPEEVLKVFKRMKDEDGIIVTKDGDTIDLDDENEDVHYKISLGESLPSAEGGLANDSEPTEEGLEEYMENSELEEDMDEQYYEDGDEPLGKDSKKMKPWSRETVDFSDIFTSDDDNEMFDDDEIVYEIELGEDMDEDMDEEMDEDMDEEMDEDMDEEMDEDMDETWSRVAEAIKFETKEGFKPKGVGMGKPKKVYPKTLKHGVTEKETTESKKIETKEGMKSIKPKGVGMGKPKFEYKEVKKMTMKPVKKGGETAEASRTLGSGKFFGKKGLPKPKAAPRHLRVENVDNELNILRERNEEYRKALNVFRDKLTEVAVFNSNLAYATRLFTEHSTTKQEKINILRRFDSVESLKESKSLYKTIKDELSSQGSATVVKESLQEKMERTPSSGSAANLIESKTYENPQFMRMKDLMSKMIK
jgi:hypothetical protein